MATTPEPDGMEHRGLLTEDDRRFLRGDKETDDPDKEMREKRYRIRRRMENVADDLELLREAGEGEVVDEFYAQIGRYERLERELADLRDRIDE